jgi:hypothetical protein
MNHKMITQRALHLLASGLSMAAQRLPFLKHLAPLMGTSSSFQIAAPLVVTIVGVDSVSGASPYVSTTGGSTNPATINAGENLVWLFRTVNETAKSFAVTGLPAGLNYTFGSPVSSITGTPTEGGTYSIKIVGWEETNLRGSKTPTYTFNLTVNAPASPLQTWTESFWSGADLTNASVSGPNADPDGDGIENLMEFVLNLDPTVGEAFPGKIQIDPADHTMMAYTLPFNPDGGEMVKFQESTSLKANDWTDIDPATSNAEVVTTAGSITLKVPLAGGARKHLRMVVSIPN